MMRDRIITLDCYEIFKSALVSYHDEIFRVTGLCAGNSPATGEFSSQRPVTRSFDVFFDLRLKNGWANNRDADDLRRHRAHYDVTVMHH